MYLIVFFAQKAFNSLDKGLFHFCVSINDFDFDMGDLNVMNVDGYIVDGGSNREVLSDGVIEEEEVGVEVDESG